MGKERSIVDRRLGVHVDVTVYSTGGTAHWCIVESVKTGRLLRSQKFVTAARRRALLDMDIQFRSFEEAIRTGQYDEDRVWGKPDPSPKCPTCGGPLGDTPFCRRAFKPLAATT